MYQKPASSRRPHLPSSSRAAQKPQTSPPFQRQLRGLGYEAGRALLSPRSEKATPRIHSVTVRADDDRGVAADVDFARVQARVVPMVLNDLLAFAHGDCLGAIWWVAARLCPDNQEVCAVDWRNAQAIAHAEGMSRAAKLSPGGDLKSWHEAAGMLAFAALVARVEGRLLIDGQYVSARAREGWTTGMITEELARRHTELLRREHSTVWRTLFEHYMNGSPDSAAEGPTFEELSDRTPRALEEYDDAHPVAPLAVQRTPRGRGFVDVPLGWGSALRGDYYRDPRPARGGKR